MIIEIENVMFKIPLESIKSFKTHIDNLTCFLSSQLKKYTL